MLDGIATTNAYTDATAISVGYAIQSGTVLQKSGNYWYRIGTSQAVDSSLVNRSTTNIVAIGVSSQKTTECTSSFSQTISTTGQYWSGLGTCAFNAATGLYYDNNSILTNATNANNICIGKGMRMIDITESTAYGSTRIPSMISWTFAKPWDGPSGSPWAYLGSSKQYVDGRNGYYFRCVHD